MKTIERRLAKLETVHAPGDLHLSDSAPVFTAAEIDQAKRELREWYQTKRGEP